jgi:single-strand DNA-binding protein
MSSSTSACSAANLAVVIGTLSRPAEARTLPSGDTLVALDVTVRPSAGPAESVPVAWPSPPAAAEGWPAGHAVVVVGRVRRRFFRAGGVTQSRVEVVAQRVVPLGRRRAVRAALEAARLELEAIEAA